MGSESALKAWTGEWPTLLGSLTLAPWGDRVRHVLE